MTRQAGGFGTRIFFLPNPGMDPKTSQILKGSGYASINVKGAHYSSQGNLWQQIFGGTDKVTLSTEVDYVAEGSTTSAASIEEVREIEVGHPYYFDSGRAIALKLPTDCDAIGMNISISAIKNDNLSGALNILNSGELHGTLEMAPPAVSTAVAIASIVKKLLTNTDPQNSLQGPYAGKLSASQSSDPIRDYCLAQGTLILIYRESEDDTSLDDLDAGKLATDGDGLKYDGSQVQNTYVMFQISFDELRGENPNAPWSQMFSDAENSLLAVQVAATDTDKQKLWVAAFAMYEQAVKLLAIDSEYTTAERTSISATRLTCLRKAFTNNGGHFPSTISGATLAVDGILNLTFENAEDIAKKYLQKLARSNLPLPISALRI